MLAANTDNPLTHEVEDLEQTLALTIIDQALADFSHQTIIDGVAVTNALLDIRRAVNPVTYPVEVVS